MFLIQQGIEHTLTLLTEADTPLRRPQWMDNNRLGRVDKASSKRKVSIFAFTGRIFECHRASRRGGGGEDVGDPVWGTGKGPLWPPMGGVIKAAMRHSERNRARQTITRDCFSSITFQQREVNVTVLPPCDCEAFIKAANCGKTGTAIKAVGGYKGGCCKPSGIEFVIGGITLQRYNEPSRYAYNTLCKSRQARSQPCWRWDTVIIGEGYDLATSNTPTCIACGSRAMRTRYGYIGHCGTRIQTLPAGKGNRSPVPTPGIHRPPGLIASRIISNNHLVLPSIKIL